MFLWTMYKFDVQMIHLVVADEDPIDFKEVQNQKKTLVMETW